MRVVEMVPRVAYDPSALFSRQSRAAFGPWFAKMEALPTRKQYELGEKLGGRLAQHMFYVKPRANSPTEVALGVSQPRELRDLICLQPQYTALWNLLTSEARNVMREMALTSGKELTPDLTYPWPLTIDGFRTHLEVPVLAAEIVSAADCRRNVSAIREVVFSSLAEDVPVEAQLQLTEKEFLEHARRFVRFGEALLSVTVKAGKGA